MRTTRSDRCRGFTLIEILIVVAVLGIVAAIAIVALGGALDKARQRASMADMRTIARAIEAYHVDNGYLPDDSGGVHGLPAVLTPYQINVVPVRDHWRNDYSYTADSLHYTLESYGKDGIAGADISFAQRLEFDLDIVLSDGQFVAAPE